MTSKTLYNTSPQQYQSKAIDKLRSQCYPQLVSNAMDTLGNGLEPHSYRIYKLLEEGCAELKPYELYHLYQILTVPELNYPAERI